MLFTIPIKYILSTKEPYLSTILFLDKVYLALALETKRINLYYLQINFKIRE